MSAKSSIEWTRGDDGTPGATWNPIKVGPHRWYCEKISPGCDNCYASTFNRRMGGAEYPKVGEGGAAGVGLVPGAAEEPLRWRKPRRVFVCSMTDLFGEWVADYAIASIYYVMAQAPQHTFQVLTKRATRMRDVLARIGPSFTELGYPWPLPNVWHGVTIESDAYAWRANVLRETPSAVRWISAEPLLGPLPSLDLTGIDWLVAGGESGGPKERRLVHGCGPRLQHRGHADACPFFIPKPEALDWVRDLRDRCAAAGVAFFFKQWGGVTPKAAGRLLDGRTWDEFPTAPSRAPAEVNI